MLASLSAWADLRARLLARRIVFGIVGAVFLGVGLLFFTIALWLLIELALGAILASVTLGMIFLGAGMLVLILGRRPVVPPAPVAAPAPAARPEGRRRPVGVLSAAGLLEAVILGIEAGRRLRRR